MTLEEAKALLSQCHRDRCVDHSFGDEEVSWFDGRGNYVAEGYFSSTHPENKRVTIFSRASFKGDVANELRLLGSLRNYSRNDG